MTRIEEMLQMVWQVAGMVGVSFDVRPRQGTSGL
jgi:hypothetical protein